MTWQDALTQLAADRQIELFRRICSDAHPIERERLDYRRLVVRLASGKQPSVWTQVKTATTAAVGFAASGFQTAPPDVIEQRKATCETCPHYDLGKERCLVCGCSTAWKAWMNRQECPRGFWKR
jgi:hypothetical protein